MALETVSGKSSQGIAFLVSAEIVYGIVTAVCATPQETEINAGAPMKWVYLGLAESALFVGAAAVFDKQHRGGIVAGGVTAIALMWWQYSHARDAGLKTAQSMPGVEY